MEHIGKKVDDAVDTMFTNVETTKCLRGGWVEK
jgi:hypothetical protein